jgi:hypothetical protein
LASVFVNLVHVDDIVRRGDRFIEVSETWQTVSPEERDALKRKADRDGEQMRELLRISKARLTFGRKAWRRSAIPSRRSSPPLAHGRGSTRG